MSTKLSTVKILLVVLGAATIFYSCLKDTHTKTYSIYTPVYKTLSEVRAGIKNNAPVPINKAGKIFIQGNFIFLNEVDKGVHIIDNTNPAAPVNKYFVSIPGNLDLAVKGNTLYADQYRDLLTIDISNPDAIAVKKITEKVFLNRTYLNGFIGDSTKVIVDWIKKDTTVADNFDATISFRRDVVFFNASASVASAVSPTTGISGSMARFTLLNNYLYTVTDQDLNIFNITDPQNPIFNNQVKIGWNIETIYPFKNNLFIGSQTGMYIFSTANPAKPTLVSTFQHLRFCDPVIADENFAFITLRTGTNCGGTFNRLEVLDISNLSSPVFIKSYDLTNPHGLSKSGNTLIICDGTAGLKVYDATTVTDLKLLQTIQVPDAFDVIMLNGNAIVVARDGIYQYDYSNPRSISFKSKISY